MENFGAEAEKPSMLFSVAAIRGRARRRPNLS